MIKEPSYSRNPVAPKKKLIVALAGIIGLMGSVFLAFLLEFFQNHRGELLEGDSGTRG